VAPTVVSVQAGIPSSHARGREAPSARQRRNWPLSVNHTLKLIGHGKAGPAHCRNDQLPEAHTLIRSDLSGEEPIILARAATEGLDKGKGTI